MSSKIKCNVGIALIISYCSFLTTGCLTTHKTKYPIASESSSLDFIKLGPNTKLRTLKCCQAGNAGESKTIVSLDPYSQPTLSFNNQVIDGISVTGTTKKTTTCQKIIDDNAFSSVFNQPETIYLDTNHKSFTTIKITISCDSSTDKLSGQWPKNPDDTNFPSGDYNLFSSNLLFGDIIQLKANHAKQPNKK